MDTERNPSLTKFASEPYVGLNEKEAKSLMLSDGDLVKVESKSGKVVGPAKILANLPDKTVLLPENFREMRLNTLMGLKEKFDPVKLTKM
jgi:NADH-quinone oxidoreductase subunit G